MKIRTSKIRTSVPVAVGLLCALMFLGTLSAQAGDGCNKDDVAPDKSSEKSGHQGRSPDSANLPV